MSRRVYAAGFVLAAVSEVALMVTAGWWAPWLTAVLTW